MPVGVLTNIATVLAGTAVGAVAGNRFPDRVRETVMGTLGLLTAAIAVPMMAALSLLQPIMLRVVGVERAVQGTLSGDLVFYQEVLVLLITPVVGAMADKVGRRPLSASAANWYAMIF